MASYIDRPNIHRLIELVFHTIPLFNHLIYICELVFESSHQPLKFQLSRNNTLNSHVFAVHRNLAKDWLIRVRSLWRIYRSEQEGSDDREVALHGLSRFLGVEKADDIQWTSAIWNIVLADINRFDVDLAPNEEKAFELATQLVDVRSVATNPLEIFYIPRWATGKKRKNICFRQRL